MGLMAYSIFHTPYSMEHVIEDRVRILLCCMLASPPAYDKTHVEPNHRVDVVGRMGQDWEAPARGPLGKGGARQGKRGEGGKHRKET